MSKPLAKLDLDELLLPYLNATDDAEADRLLGRLVVEHGRPLIRLIVQSTLRSASSEGKGLETDFLEDIGGEVELKLLKRLRAFKANPQGEAFGRFRSYVAVAAYNECYAHLRRTYPQRHRLKTRLRYVLTQHRELSLWTTAENRWVCGLAVWRPEAQPGPLRRWINRARGTSKTTQPTPRLAELAARLDLPDLLPAIFETLGAPIEFDRLVSLVAELQGVKDEAPVYEDGLTLEKRCSPVVDPATEAEQRIFLEQAWAEIRKLPLAQRTALLLNLKDAQGRDLLSLLVSLRIATASQVATALEMSPERFTELWNALPMEDTVIAQFLGVTRQQVINLRLSARRRLSRRMRAGT